MSSLNVSSLSVSSGSLVWGAPSSGGSPAAVLVEVSVNGGSYTTLATLPGSSTNYGVGSFTGGSSYQYRVTAENAAGQATPQTTSTYVIPQIGSHTLNSAGAASQNVWRSTHGSSLSRSGRWALFHTTESLVAGDTNGVFDVYLTDLYTGNVKLVSATSAGIGGNAASTHGSFSGDERWIVFTSNASDLSAVSDGNAGAGDVFVMDRDSDNDGIYDEVSATTIKQLTVTAPDGSAGDGDSQGATLSNSGRYVAIRSGSTNLVAGDTNGVNDAFRLDRDSDGDGIFDETGDYSWVRVSVNSAGGEVNAATDVPRISGNGDLIGLRTNAALVASDTNNDWDAYLATVNGSSVAITLISANPADGTALGSVNHVRITRDGKWVSFDAVTTANINGTNSNRDVFLYSVTGNSLKRITKDVDGNATDNTSSDAYPVSNGSTVYLVFDSIASDLIAGDTNNTRDVFLWTSTDNGATGTISRELAANDTKINLAAGISEDGTLLLTTSETALNANDTNTIRDLYTLRRDPTLVKPGVVSSLNVSSLSVSSGSLVWGAPSSGGSPAAVLVEVSVNGGSYTTLATLPGSSTNYGVGSFTGGSSYQYRVTAENAAGQATPQTTSTYVIPQIGSHTLNSAGAASQNVWRSTHGSSLSRSGRWALFHTTESLVAGDTNGVFDVYLTDLYTGNVKLVSATSAGIGGNAASTHGSFSGDERWIVFTSNASDLSAVSDGNAGAGDVFVMDRDSDNDGIYDEVSATTIKQLTVTAPDGSAGDGDSQGATLSNSGRYVAIRSGSTNLVAGDTNGVNDAFRLDRDSDGDGIFDETGDYSWVRVSVNSAGGEVNAATDVPRISGNGDLIGLRTNAALVASDTNNDWDAYLATVNGSSVAITLISANPADGTALGSVNHVRITRDGKWVSFDAVTTANINGTNSNRDVFLYSVTGNSLKRITKDVDGNATDNTSSDAYPVSNGSTVYLVFDSIASDLIAGDTNNTRDVFLWTSTDNGATGTISRELAANDTKINLAAGISEDGTLLLTTSETALNANDTNTIRDLYTLRRS